MKVYRAQKTDSGYSVQVPIGFEKLGGMNFFTLKIKKPSGSIITKSLDINNIIPEFKHIKFTLISGEVDEEGIYDYQVINTTNSYVQIGKKLQFYVDANIF